ncbi:MAG: aspartyl protease family protein [Parvularculaceae bacterium]
MKRPNAYCSAFSKALAALIAPAKSADSTRRAAQRGFNATIPKILQIFLFTLAACVSQPAQPPKFPEPIAEIPFEIDYEGWITVQATVNGEGPYDFIVDSGATITSVFENLAREQTFSPVERPPIKILGLTAAEQLPAYFLGEIQIGGQRLQNHIGVILPDWAPPRRPPNGVLGLDFLTRFIVHVDVNEKLIRLYDPGEDLDGLGDAWSKTPLKPDDFNQNSGTLYRVTADMQGRPIPCLVDLGASGTMLNYHALRRLLSGIFINQPRETGFFTGTRLNDIFDNTEVARLVHVKRITIAGAKWRDKLLTVFDAPVFDELGVDNKPYCLIGSDLMLEFSFIFDFRRQLLYIGPQARL